MKFPMIKKDGALLPLDATGEEHMAKIKEDAGVIVTVTTYRNLKHHRMYWALMHLVWDNLPESRAKTWPKPENISDAIKIATGHVDVCMTVDGKNSFLKPKSISFEKMGQEEFNQFFNQAVEVIVKQIIPGLDCRALEDEVLDMVA